MPTHAKALTITAPYQIALLEYTVPDLPKGGMLIKMELSGICGTDKHTYKGETRQYAGTSVEKQTPYPLIPGHENVGIIADIRKGVKDFYGEPLSVGDRITMCPDIVCGKCYGCRHIFAYPWCERLRGYGNAFKADEEPLMGGWGEYMLIIPEAFVYKVPEGLRPELAVYTELMACTYIWDKAKEFSSLASEGFLSGDTLLIQGMGPLGIANLIKARMMGAGQIIVTDVSDYRLEQALLFGADKTLNVAKTSKEERLELVRQWTKGRGVDVALECVGRPEVVAEGINMVRRGGMYLLQGLFVDMGEVPLNPHLLVSKSIRMIGLSNHPITGYGPSMELMLRYQDKMPLDKFVSHKFPLEKAKEALETAMGPNSMKVVFEP
jgi:threonine dehydrogenase-like Zn-dependent dehydrogenase